MIRVLLQSKSPWQRNDAITFLYTFSVPKGERFVSSRIPEYCQLYEFLFLIGLYGWGSRKLSRFPTINFVIRFVLTLKLRNCWEIWISKSTGPDCISPRILRECTQVLSSPLALFLNTSFSQGQLPCYGSRPTSLQFTRKGAKILMENSRQISLTCIVCKIAEAVVRTLVVDYWSDLNQWNRWLSITVD